MPHQKRSIFITFEGGEGAGKTTLINKLSQELHDQSYDVVSTRAPGGTPLGKCIRETLLHHDPSVSISAQAELMLFLADRAQHLEELIKPALAAGKVVLCDRFNDSTVAYQGMARGLGMEAVQQLCDLVCGGLIPNVTFFLDLDPQAGMQRALRRSQEAGGPILTDRIETEKVTFHQRVRQGLLQIAKMHPQRIRILDASLPAEEVFRQALKEVKSLLGAA